MTVAASENADGIAAWEMRRVGAAGFTMQARGANGQAVVELSSGPQQNHSTIHLIV